MKTASTIYGTLAVLSPFKVKRRAVSEIIATLLLMGVTVVGGILAFTMIGSFTDPGSQIGKIETEERIELIGYDSRDGPDLAGITDLSNFKSNPTPFLCTASCSASPDNAPSLSGTEFIVIYLHNDILEDVFLGDIFISASNVAHEWDGGTAGEILDDDGAASTDFPAAGMYSIVPEAGTDDLTQRSNTMISGTETVRVVIKLSEDISSDIDIDDTIPITVTTAEGNTFKFNIHGGSVL